MWTAIARCPCLPPLHMRSASVVINHTPTRRARARAVIASRSVIHRRVPVHSAPAVTRSIQRRSARRKPSRARAATPRRATRPRIASTATPRTEASRPQSPRCARGATPTNRAARSARVTPIAFVATPRPPTHPRRRRLLVRRATLAKRVQYRHQPTQRCADCHTAAAHAPKEIVACASCHAAEASSAPPGHQACASCHQPHDPKHAVASCATCHADKHHGNNLACTTCHRPHGPTGVASPPACTTCHATATLPPDCIASHNTHMRRLSRRSRDHAEERSRDVPRLSQRSREPRADGGDVRRLPPVRAMTTRSRASRFRSSRRTCSPRRNLGGSPRPRRDRSGDPDAAGLDLANFITVFVAARGHAVSSFAMTS